MALAQIQLFPELLKPVAEFSVNMDFVFYVPGKEALDPDGIYI